MQNLRYQKKKKMYNFTIFFKDSCFIPKISNRKLKYLYDCVTKAKIYKIVIIFYQNIIILFKIYSELFNYNYLTISSTMNITILSTKKFMNKNTLYKNTFDYDLKYFMIEY